MTYHYDSDGPIMVPMSIPAGAGRSAAQAAALIARLHAAKADKPPMASVQEIEARVRRAMNAEPPTLDAGEEDAPERSGRKRRPLAIPDKVDSQTMLRLEIAARLGFPDGSMSLSDLRREAVAGRLTTYRIAGKDFTTLADIEEMKIKCRVPAKAHDSTSRKPETASDSGSSATGSGPSALDALKANATKLKESLSNTSPPSTILKPAGAAVIPMPSKSRTP